MTPLLLDTHALLWSIGQTGRLSRLARQRLQSGETIVYVSAASVWEIAIKRNAGKLKAPDTLVREIAEASFIELPVSFKHATLAGELPLHHRDPFDRMIVAQATSEGLTVLTSDPRFAAYGVPVLW
ncbi:MAG: type II toxin-antitoxin system VapC family toxin [Solirubrobacteraceae bacterium]